LGKEGVFLENYGLRGSSASRVWGQERDTAFKMFGGEGLYNSALIMKEGGTGSKFAEGKRVSGTKRS